MVHQLRNSYPIDSIRQLNWEHARQISRQTRHNPGSPYVGKFVGIAEQRVVAVADSWDELHARLNELGYDRKQRVGIEANADYERPVLLWNPRFLKTDDSAPGAQL